MHEKWYKHYTEEGKKLYEKEKKKVVNPVFGLIKNSMNIREFKLKRKPPVVNE
jgi:hypothetical protein